MAEFCAETFLKMKNSVPKSPRFVQWSCSFDAIASSDITEKQVEETKWYGQCPVLHVIKAIRGVN